MRTRPDGDNPGKAMPRNRLGVFVRSPVAGEVKTRLAPALTGEGARELYLGFLADLTTRLRDSKYRPIIFMAGERTADVAALLDPKWPVAAQSGGHLGDRLTAAFAEMLREPDSRAVIIGSDSPDLPLPYLKRAFQALKHRDVVIGPAVDGGYYLIGLRRAAPALFRDIEWGTPRVFGQTLDAVEREGMTLALLPPWYDVDDPASLGFFAALVRARRLSGTGRLRHSERIVATLPKE